jgi:hypothetical protein
MKKTIRLLGIIAVITAIGFSLLSCDNTHTHTHDFSGAWKKDATQHWKECSDDDGAEDSRGNHTFNGNICSVCQYDKTVPHEHDFSGAWVTDATDHWKVCAADSTVGQKAAHVDANTDEKCDVCGYDMHVHDFTGAWVTDAADHWKVCAADSTVGQKAAHVDVNTDEECDVCGYDMHVHNFTWTVTSDTYPAQSMATCTCGETETTRDTAVGDTGPGGGIIFYVSTEGFTVTGTGSFTAHYLEAAPANMTTLAWASSGFTSRHIPGTETDIGTGKANTAIILATDANAPAAKACADYRGGGKDDWFLPSRDELNEMYIACSHLGISSGYFWFSSQYNNLNAWFQNFVNGTQDWRGKDNTYSVRAVRAF